MAENPLGKNIPFPEQYSPELLLPIPRRENRSQLGLGASLPFSGVDVWNAYELSWLETTGKPAVAILRMTVPCESPFLVESKSLKLYLSSFNQARFEQGENLLAVIHRDLERVLGVAPELQLLPLQQATAIEAGPEGICLDGLPVNIEDYQLRPGLLAPGQEGEQGGGEKEEKLYSHLFRSNCPITGQPDWATVDIAYRGPAIHHAGLLQYLVSYRQHSDYHENCVERIFLDIQAHCQPQSLMVQARFTRRGGIDINPLRVTPGLAISEFRRLVRQ